MLPNILLIVLDTARADAFEPYGATRGSTPALADLATAGSHCALAYAPSCWTVPSHAAMFTGRLPRATGLLRAPDGPAGSVRPAIERLQDVLLPAVLQRWGYRTAGVSCNAWVSSSGGWNLGFDEFTYVPSRRTNPSLRHPKRTARWLWHAAVADIDDGAGEAASVMRDWFARWDGREPFFWFVNLVECHAPYMPPNPWNDLPARERMRSAVDARRYQSLLGVVRQTAGEFDVPESALARMRHLYAKAIRLLDDWVNRIVSLLEDRGVLDDTILVVTSDHGENFGEGGLLGHCASVDERLIHVPFITHGPVEPPTQGSWSIMGLPALLARALGRTDRPWPDVDPGAPAPAQVDQLAARTDPQMLDLSRRLKLDEGGVRRLSEPFTAVVDGSSKLVQHGEERYWYDLRKDPLETNPLPAASCPDHLTLALADPGLWERSESMVTRPNGRRTAHTDTELPEDVAALEEQMRLLGYL